MDSLFRRAVCLSSSSLRGPRAARWFAVLGASCALALLSAPASAATLSWGTSGAGGGGTWNTTTSNWWNGSNVAWSNAANDDAVFTGTPGTVTLTTSNTANSLTFDSFTSTYTLALNNQTLAIGGGGITMNAGAGNATLSGAGTILLTSTQSWTNSSTTGLLTVSSNVNNNGKLLAIAGSGSTSISGIISGSGGLTKSGNGTLTLSAVNTYQGPTTITGGTLQIGGGGSLGSGTYGGAIAISAGGAFNYASTASGTVSGVISGAGNLVKGNTGTLVLAGLNTYTGTTWLNGGLLSGSAAANFGNGGPMVFNGGGLQVTGTSLTSLSGRTVTFTSGSSATFDIAAAANTFTVDQAMNLGTGGLTKSGSGTLVLNQANTITGATLIAGGTLAVSRADTVTQSTSLGYFIGGPGGLANAGNGTLVLDRTNYLTGLTRATSGTIQLATAQALQYSPLDATSPGSFTLSGVTAPVIGGLSGTTGSAVLKNLDTTGASLFASGYGSVTNLTLSGSVSPTYGGVIADGAAGTSLTVNKAGWTFSSVWPSGLAPSSSLFGTQTLTGSNTYTGTTKFLAGTLALSGSGSIATSTGYVFNVGSLTLTNTSSAEGAIDRLRDASGINSASGGTLTYANTLGTGTYAESVGSVTLGAGQFNVVLSSSMTTGTQTLTFAGLTRAPTTSGSTATATFSALGTGPQEAGNRNMIAVTGAGTTVSGSIVGPWATVGTAAGTPTDYAFFNNGYIVAAGTSGVNNTASSWTSGSNPVVNNAATASLSANATANTIRYIGGAGTLALGNFQLQTTGILNIGSGALSITGSSLTAPTAGNLFLTTGGGNISVSGTITDAPGGGAVALVVSGPGRVTLTGTNSYTGGTFLNNSSLSVTTDVNLGAASGGLTVSGYSTILVDGGDGTTTIGSGRTITLNEGAIVALGAATGGGGRRTIAAKFTGPGGLTYGGSVLAQGFTPILSNTASDFTGPLEGIFTVGGIGDSSNPIVLGGFSYTGPAKTLALRPFVMTGTAGATISGGGSGPLTIQQDLVNTGVGARTLTFSGVPTTGTNVFAGRLFDPAGGALSVTVGSAGRWILSGTNSYSGPTTISFAGSQGLLVFQGMQSLSTNTSLNTATSAGGGGGANGLYTILDDSATPASRSGVNLNFNVGETGANDDGRRRMNVFVGNNSVANGGTSASTQANSTIQLGDLNIAVLNNSGNVGAGLLVTGSNGYKLQIANVNVSLAGNFTNNWPVYLTATNSLIVTGNVRQLAGSPSANITLQLEGSGTASLISGNILDSADFTPRSLHLTKQGAGTWTLSGANTYSGTTTVSAGVLNLANASAIGTGPLTMTGGALDAASNLTLSTNNPQNWNGSFSFVGSNPLNLGTGTVTLGATPTVTVLSSTLTVAGPVTGGAFGLTKTGAGTLTLSAANTYTGTTTVSAGVLRLGVAGALADGSSLAVNGGGFDLNGNNETVAAVTLSSGSVFGAGKLTAATYGLSGGTVAGNLGGGTLTVTGNSALNGTSDATAVNLNAGALTLGSGSRFTSSSVAVTGSSGASLALGGNETFGSLAGGANIALGGNRLSVGGLGTSTSYSGTISGAGGVTKLGTGKLTFTSAQLHTGATIISGGTLALGSAGSFASSSEVVVGDAGSSGAVLDLTDKASVVIGVGQTLKGIGTALLGPTTALTVSGTFSPGNSPGLFTYDGGSTTLAGTTMMEIFGTSRGVLGGYDAVDVTNIGLLTFGGSLVFDFSQTFAENDTFLLFQGLSGGSLAGTFGSYSITGSSDYTGLTFAQVGTSNVWRTGQTGAGQALELTYGSSALTLSVVAAVPEPGALALAGCGLGFIGWKTWRRRNRRHA